MRRAESPKTLKQIEMRMAGLKETETLITLDQAYEVQEIGSYAELFISNKKGELKSLVLGSLIEKNAIKNRILVEATTHKQGPQYLEDHIFHMWLPNTTPTALWKRYRFVEAED